MRDAKVSPHQVMSHTDQGEYSRTIFGFWVYLLTDFMMFAALFAVYVVLRKNTLNGPGPKELFDLRSALVQTLVLLFGTFFVGMAGVYAHRNKRRKTLLYFGLTFILNSLFLWLMVSDLRRLIEMGQTWKNSGFLSAYFTLVATFGVHVAFALLWTIVLLVPVLRGGIELFSLRRLVCLRMFWQFLNIIWIFIFSIVYLLRGIP